ncbi:hypothetical protein [Methanopyrus sp. KOL6]|uniref:hypothetical protein n=1 Tax=Methanopyrus sp. KOL6 TaxID=1937004 RepID=UPI0012F73404|nr:hypothetical protein [Methanopyrus sp. KOL6]
MRIRGPILLSAACLALASVVLISDSEVKWRVHDALYPVILGSTEAKDVMFLLHLGLLFLVLPYRSRIPLPKIDTWVTYALIVAILAVPPVLQILMTYEAGFSPGLGTCIVTLTERPETSSLYHCHAVKACLGTLISAIFGEPKIEFHCGIPLSFVLPPWAPLPVFALLAIAYVVLAWTVPLRSDRTEKAVILSIAGFLLCLGCLDGGPLANPSVVGLSIFLASRIRTVAPPITSLGVLGGLDAFRQVLFYLPTYHTLTYLWTVFLSSLLPSTTDRITRRGILAVSLCLLGMLVPHLPVAELLRSTLGMASNHDYYRVDVSDGNPAEVLAELSRIPGVEAVSIRVTGGRVTACVKTKCGIKLRVPKAKVRKIRGYILELRVLYGSPRDLTESLKSTSGVVGVLGVKKMGSVYRVELGAEVDREVNLVPSMVKQLRRHGVVVSRIVTFTDVARCIWG